MASHEVSPFELLGASAAVRECAGQVALAAQDERGVLITAGPGLDAETIARAVQARSARKAGPFVAVPCAGAPAGDLERTLFGTYHRAGAAELEVIGPAAVLAHAARGVLFLSHVHEMPGRLQRRLARVLRDGEVRVQRRTGTTPIDVRVIAARDDVDAAIREDLLRRLPILINVPALRERRGDVPVIAEAMLAARDRTRRFTPAALTVLAALPWRRNTAELSRLVERLVASHPGGQIRQEDVLAEVQLDKAPMRARGSLREARRQFEREYIAAVLREHEWHMPDAARALGIERANLYRKARQLGIPLRPGGDTSQTRITS